jgi:hypothetical protein
MAVYAQIDQTFTRIERKLTGMLVLLLVGFGATFALLWHILLRLPR